MRSPDIPPAPTMTSKFRKAPGTHNEAFSLTTVDGVALKGVIGSGYLNGAYVYLLEFRGGGEEYRWIFNDEIPEKSMAVLKEGLRLEPGYRDQFRKPAVPAKEVDLVTLSALLTRAFGDHTIDTTGTIEPVAHSWESRLRIVLAEPIPAAFASFARKCPYLTLNKTRRQDCLTVTAPLGNAAPANLLLIQAIEDFASGKLGEQSKYELNVTKISTWPTKPEHAQQPEPKPKAPPSSSKPAIHPFNAESLLTLSDKIARVGKAQDPKEKRRLLMFLKAGRDEFSLMKLEQVEALLDPDDVSSVYKAILKPDDRLKSMRWILRGLPASDAILKTEIEIESTQRFIERHNEKNRSGSRDSGYSW